MNLENIKIGQGLSLDVALNPLPEESFKELIRTIKECYKNMGINIEKMNLEYHRFFNSNSVLAIKLLEESNYEKSNYMFIGCSPRNYNGKVCCDVFMHADAKCAKEATKMSRRISQNIVNFFEKAEESLVENGMSDMEFSVTIPLSETTKQPVKNNSDEDCIPKRIAKVFYRKHKRN